jgi:hypothetical protein
MFNLSTKYFFTVYIYIYIKVSLQRNNHTIELFIESENSLKRSTEFLVLLALEFVLSLIRRFYYDHG